MKNALSDTILKLICSFGMSVIVWNLLFGDSIEKRHLGTILAPIFCICLYLWLRPKFKKGDRDITQIALVALPIVPLAIFYQLLLVGKLFVLYAKKHGI